jgi:hypothetical protein
MAKVSSPEGGGVAFFQLPYPAMLLDSSGLRLKSGKKFGVKNGSKGHLMRFFRTFASLLFTGGAACLRAGAGLIFIVRLWRLIIGKDGS